MEPITQHLFPVFLSPSRELSRGKVFNDLDPLRSEPRLAAAVSRRPYPKVIQARREIVNPAMGRLMAELLSPSRLRAMSDFE